MCMVLRSRVAHSPRANADPNHLVAAPAGAGIVRVGIRSRGDGVEHEGDARFGRLEARLQDASDDATARGRLTRILL